MDLCLIKTMMVKGKDGKMEEAEFGYYGGKNPVYAQYKDRREYFDRNGKVGFVVRTDKDKEIAKKYHLGQNSSAEIGAFENMDKFLADQKQQVQILSQAKGKTK